MTHLEHALRYASLGWPLFRVWPALPDGRCACTTAPESVPTRKDHANGKGSPGKHPLVGQGEATTDEATLRAWWATPAFQPSIAMRCGPDAGVWVLDVDPRNGGHESLAALVAANGPLPETAAARSGGGGLHLFFRWPAGRDRALARRSVGPGLDVISGDAPYVILPPSAHASGGRYEWVRPPWGVAPAPIEP